MHAIVGTALAGLGVEANPFSAVCVKGEPFTGLLCFQHFTSCDLMIQNAKVLGSAQRKQRGAILQHGGILLSQSPFTPALPGIRELSRVDLSARQVTEAVCRTFTDETGWTLEPRDWTTAEGERREVIVREKYGSDAWNLKR